jgi:hypothetical protein
MARMDYVDLRLKQLPVECVPEHRRVESRCGAVGLGAAYLLPAISLAGASLASPCVRFHIPLIEPDVRISRFRLSEKGSRSRPREIMGPLAKADEPQHVVQGCLRKTLGPRHRFVLGTQPLT